MSIQAVPEGDASVQAAAEFAVKDYNEKSTYRPLMLVGVDKAAVKMLKTGGMIYYLSVRLQNKYGAWKDPPPFSTAVLCVPPSMEPSKTVEFVELDGYMMQDDTDDEENVEADTKDKYEGTCSADHRRELNAVAELALRYHKDQNLQLEDVLDCLNLIHDETDEYLLIIYEYLLTLQVWDASNSKTLVVETVAITSRPWGDEFFYSTPLIILAHKPYPGWISVPLLRAVSADSLEHFQVFHKENDSDPIIFLKNADCLYQLPNFANLLGRNKTILELIPFLGENNDHVGAPGLNLMAGEIQKLIPYLGDKSHLLLPPLFSICKLAPHAIEEATASFEKIAAQATKDKDYTFCSMFVPFVMELSSSHSVLHRSLSCGLFSIAYPTATEQMKHYLIASYQKLSHDHAPAVRGFLAATLEKFAAAIHDDRHSTIFEDVCPRLALDEHEHVRFLAARKCKALAKSFPNNTHLFTVMVEFSKDTCKEVRTLAQTFIYEFHVAADVEQTSAEAACQSVDGIYYTS